PDMVAFRCEIRLEHAGQGLIGDAAALIGNDEVDTPSLFKRMGGHAAAPFFQGLGGVHEKVDHDLFEPGPAHGHEVLPRRNPELDPGPLEEPRSAQEPCRLLELSAEIDDLAL